MTTMVVSPAEHLSRRMQTTTNVFYIPIDHRLLHKAHLPHVSLGLPPLAVRQLPILVFLFGLTTTHAEKVPLIFHSM